MKAWTVVVAVALAATLGGCAMWQGRSLPNFPAGTKEAAVDPLPVIKLVITHQHKLEGDRREAAEGMSRKAFQYGFDAVLPESAIVRNASESPTADVHYVLFIDTAINEHGQGLAMLSGATLMLFPVVIDSDVIATASLYEAATGQEIGVYDAKTVVNTLIWLPLLPVMPITLFTGPGKKPYETTLRGVFIQLANQLQGRPLPEAIDPARESWERCESRRELIKGHLDHDVRLSK